MRTLSCPSPAASLRLRTAPRCQPRHGCSASASTSASGVGRSVVVLPGLGNASGDYDDFCRDLRAATGGVVLAARVSRPDWCVSQCLLVFHTHTSLTPPPPRRVCCLCLALVRAQAEECCRRGGPQLLARHAEPAVRAHSDDSNLHPSLVASDTL